ncbi:hypothetical protein AOL_s00004g384 [Orbilia oligospora ATCC 24927]|uniref:TECPR1-like DysF domain-containing protein n=2 Tax=Orbilia oligospora TaxID=2813651 RepID=G1WYM4_ARTOA|nr:hypothetical protein AOL_s00004g384 [Orbilia oligospora ATCC 24927]EGX54351.1 hypothetical protein AOL_s00004g384 [Orbilia oligospora ATCC 24927]KAF3278181.1 hypothetical protein TWF970_004637 [Orbilia oligospora]
MRRASDTSSMHSDAEDDDSNGFPDSDVSSRSFLHPDDTPGTNSSSSGRRRHFATKIAKHYQRSKESLKEAREDLKNKDEEGRPTTFAAGPTENIISYPDYRDFKSIGGFASGLQDKLFAKMIGGILPADAVEHYSGAGSDKRKDTERPQFSVTVMSGNFRRFNQRIGVVFVLQHRLIRLMTWRKPTHTLSALALYSFICLDPYLIASVPLAAILLFVMVPAYISRHPPAPSRLPTDPYPSRGPPSAIPPEVKAVSEFSKDFFRNLRDLQNTMEDFSAAHDQVIQILGPPTNFSSETLSSGVFLILSFITLALFIGARHVPWQPVMLVTGWGITILCHPSMQQPIQDAHKQHVIPSEKRARKVFKQWVAKDIILDTKPDEREVEIFELQRKDSNGEWEAWMFSPLPYEKLSAARLAGEKPRGTRFLEDVIPPKGWHWMDEKWMLDLASKDWVEERYLEGVEVEIAEERWVYDILTGDEGYRGTGEWRRRRWLRTVRRHVVNDNGFIAYNDDTHIAF